MGVRIDIGEQFAATSTCMVWGDVGLGGIAGGALNGLVRAPAEGAAM